MEKELNKVTTITNSLEEKKKLQSFLDAVKDKPLFKEKIDGLNEVIKELTFFPNTD